MSRFINRVGQRFGRLVVVAYVGQDKGRATWDCVCDCGGTLRTRGTSIAYGSVKSCGCLFTEMLVKRNTTHGKTHTPEHKAWIAMIGRCYETSNTSYPRYGGRGIGVCDRWRYSFESFLSDLGPKPSPKHSLDRIDNTRGYEVGNVRWATAHEQANNRSSNRMIEWRGETKTMAEWARETGTPWYMIQKRLRVGWPIGRAMTEPRHGSW